MFSVTLVLPDQIENKLAPRAKAQGRDVASIAVEMIEESLR